MSAANRPYAPARITVDLVILTVREDRLHVLLVERAHEPYRGMPALPGGFLHDDETLEAAARRELAEETALESVRLEQVRAYSTPDRDPRGWVVTVSYLAIAPRLPAPVAGSDARAARWAPVDTARGLAFDHDQILADSLERTRRKLADTTVATAFCENTATIGELRRVYELVNDARS